MASDEYRTYKNPDEPHAPAGPAPRPRRSGNGSNSGWLKSALAIMGTAALSAGVTWIVTDTLARRREEREALAATNPGAGTVIPTPIPMFAPPPGYFPAPHVVPAAPPPQQVVIPSQAPTPDQLIELARLRRDAAEYESERQFFEGFSR